MPAWSDLERELDHWTGDIPAATLWWRDDDAITVTPQFETLIKYATVHDVPVALAVIPSAATSELAAYLKHRQEVAILQHGYSHTNHAPENEKKAEFAAHRPCAAMLDDLVQGARLLGDNFPTVKPVLVPPWNRICDDVANRLPEIGIPGLSTFRARSDMARIPGLHRVNTHIDIIDWRETRNFTGTEIALADLIAHLQARRAGTVDPEEPTGLLTHHLVHTQECWQFLDHLFRITNAHKAAIWQSADIVFGRQNKTSRNPSENTSQPYRRQKPASQL
ncbi:MAG: polysaccharide deacetylase family protein [Hyphomicrobiaceae bacterium]